MSTSALVLLVLGLLLFGAGWRVFGWLGYSLVKGQFFMILDKNPSHRPFMPADERFCRWFLKLGYIGAVFALGITLANRTLYGYAMVRKDELPADWMGY